jgi:hypothetical protein
MLIIGFTTQALVKGQTCASSVHAIQTTPARGPEQKHHPRISLPQHQLSHSHQRSDEIDEPARPVNAHTSNCSELQRLRNVLDTVLDTRMSSRPSILCIPTLLLQLRASLPAASLQRVRGRARALCKHAETQQEVVVAVRGGRLVNSGQGKDSPCEGRRQVRARAGGEGSAPHTSVPARERRGAGNGARR